MAWSKGWGRPPIAVESDPDGEPAGRMIGEDQREVRGHNERRVVNLGHGCERQWQLSRLRRGYALLQILAVRVRSYGEGTKPIHFAVLNQSAVEGMKYFGHRKLQATQNIGQGKRSRPAFRDEYDTMAKAFGVRHEKSTDHVDAVSASFILMQERISRSIALWRLDSGGRRPQARSTDRPVMCLGSYDHVLHSDSSIVFGLPVLNGFATPDLVMRSIRGTSGAPPIWKSSGNACKHWSGDGNAMDTLHNMQA